MVYELVKEEAQQLHPVRSKTEFLIDFLQLPKNRG